MGESLTGLLTGTGWVVLVVLLPASCPYHQLIWNWSTRTELWGKLDWGGSTWHLNLQNCVLPSSSIPLSALSRRSSDLSLMVRREAARSSSLLTWDLSWLSGSKSLPCRIMRKIIVSPDPVHPFRFGDCLHWWGAPSFGPGVLRQPGVLGSMPTPSIAWSLREQWVFSTHKYCAFQM